MLGSILGSPVFGNTLVAMVQTNFLGVSYSFPFKGAFVTRIYGHIRARWYRLYLGSILGFGISYG